LYYVRHSFLNNRAVLTPSRFGAELIPNSTI
jgi:hypothetical protein